MQIRYPEACPYCSVKGLLGLSHSRPPKTRRSPHLALISPAHPPEPLIRLPSPRAHSRSARSRSRDSRSRPRAPSPSTPAAAPAVPIIPIVAPQIRRPRPPRPAHPAAVPPLALAPVLAVRAVVVVNIPQRSGGETGPKPGSPGASVGCGLSAVRGSRASTCGSRCTGIVASGA